MLTQGGSLTGVAAAREGVAAIRAHAWLVVALAIVGLLVGYLVEGPGGGGEYRAWVKAEALGSNGSVTELGISTPDGPQAADFLSDGIIARLEGVTGDSYDYLFDHLTLSQPPDGGPNPPIALIVSVESDDEARALLGDWLAAIHEARLRYVGRVLARGERGLRKSLDRAANREESATQKAIVDLLARIQALRPTLTVDYAIVRKPRPVDASGVSRPRAAAIGAVGGLIGGLALALALALVGGRLRTPEGIEAALGVELLADLRSPGAIPSPEHARERLRSLCGGSLPAGLLLVPCGDVTPDPTAKVSGALGEGIDVRAAGPLGQAGLIGELERANAWAIVATPGAVRRAEAAALQAELGGIGAAPAGLFVV
jgi:hypothetical protein